MSDVARRFATSNALEETGRMPALFVRERMAPSAPSPLPSVPSPEAGPDFDRIQHGKEFVSLRKTFRRFVFPMSLLFFTWYMTFVLLAAYAHEFMSKKVFGEVNVGILMGLGQFASTVLITIVYVKFANHRLDPKVEELRAMVQADQR